MDDKETGFTPKEVATPNEDDEKPFWKTTSEGDLTTESYRSIVGGIAADMEQGSLTEGKLDDYHEKSWGAIDNMGGVESNMGSNAKRLLDVTGNYREALRKAQEESQ